MKGLNNSSNISFKMLHTTQEHKNANNKMADRRVAATIISFLLLDDDEVKTRGKTRSWIKRRKQRGAFSNIIQELRMEDTASFKEMLRMDYDTFLNLLTVIEPYISLEESYHGVATVKANERLTLTLHRTFERSKVRKLDKCYITC